MQRAAILGRDGAMQRAAILGRNHAVDHIAREPMGEAQHAPRLREQEIRSRQLAQHPRLKRAADHGFEQPHRRLMPDHRGGAHDPRARPARTTRAHDPRARPARTREANARHALR